MKNKLLIMYGLFVFLLFMTGCEAISDIFNAGMAVGVFFALLVIALIIFVVSRIRRRNK